MDEIWPNERIGDSDSESRSISGVRKTDTGVAKVFYCDGLSGRLGVLRAVIPVAELQFILSRDKSKYVGKSFPKMKEDGTVIEIASDEQGTWKRGFYRAAKTPLEFEEHLQGL